MEEREQLVEGAFLGFSPKLAASIGLNEAIFLNQLHYWKQRSKNERDGYTWVYKTYVEWQGEFPFWSNATIRRTIKNLEKEDLLISSSNYNKMGIDKTKWYRINYKKLDGIAIAQNEQMDCSNCTDELLKMSNGTTQNEQMDSSERANELLNMDKQTAQNEHTNNHILHHKITHDSTSLNHNKNNLQEIPTTNQPTAPNISYSVDSSNEAEKKEKEQSVGRSVPFQEQLEQLVKSYEFAIGPVDETISKSLMGFITLYKDHRLIAEALKELSQTELPNNISVNSIPAIISKWKSHGIYNYDQLIAKQESDNLVKSIS